MEFLFSQLNSFTVMIVYGFFLAFSFDIYIKISGNLKKINKYLLNIGDLMFGIISGIIAFSILVLINWGNFRLYIFIAIFLGILIYTFMKKKYLIGEFL